MTEAEALLLIRRHFEGLFPRSCSGCGRTFATLRDYILTTETVGGVRSYDAELGDWAPDEPLGSMALANCPCGNTISLGTDGMALEHRLALLNFVKEASERLAVAPAVVLERLRDEVRNQVLSEATS